MTESDRLWQWPVLPPEDGFTAEDLDRIEDLPAHTELLDGGLVLRPPQRRFHYLTTSLLERALLDLCPEKYKVWRGMTVTLGEHHRLEPDLVVIKAEADTGDNAQATLHPHDVKLVVEVESPDSQVRDRDRKPQLYARSGIPRFWRVQEDDGLPTVHTYDLDDTTRSYASAGVHRYQLRVVLPFEAKIDLTAIEEL